MDYQEYDPPTDLRDRVRCAWTLCAPIGGTPADPTAVLPDGHPELVLNFADAMRHHPPGEDGRLQPPVLLAGVITRPFHLSATGAMDLLGVRFEPAGAHALALGGMQDLVDDWSPPAAVDRWHRTLEALRSVPPDERVNGIWGPLKDRLAAGPEPPNDAVLRAAAQIVRQTKDMPIADIARSVGLSPRQLGRRFRKEVGVGPKLLARIARFQRALAHMTGRNDGRQPTAAGAAVAAGYVDQTHMISDVADFSGLTPGKLLAAAQPLADLFTRADLSGDG